MAQLDASIIGGIKPIEIPDQTNLLLKGLQAQGLMGQNQLQQLQIGQQQQSYARQNALMQYLASPDGQSDDLNTRINKSVMIDPINGPKIAESYLNTQKTQADIASTKATTGKTQYDLQHNQIVAAGGELGAAAQQGADAVLNVIKTSPNIPEEARSQLLQQAKTDPNGPVGFAAQRAAATMTAQQQIEAGRPGVIEAPTGPVFYSKTNPGAGFTVMQPQGTSPGAPSPTQAPPTQAMPVGSPPPGFPAVSPQQQTQRNGDALVLLTNELTLPENQNPANQAAIKSEIARYQTAAATARPFSVSLTTGGQPAGATNGTLPPPSVQPQPASPPVASNPFMKFDVKTDPLTGRMVAVSTTPGPDGNFVTRPVGTGDTGKISPQDQSIVDQIAAYKLAPPSGMALRNPRMANIMEAVAEQHPEFDATQYGAKQKAMRDFASGPQGNTLRSIGVASNHLDQLSEAANALQSGQFPAVNKVLQFFNVQSGGTAVGSFNALKQVVGDEVVKAVLGGAGGVGDREGIQKTLDAAKNPQDLANIIQHYRGLMAAQRDGLEAQYAGATGNTDAAVRFGYAQKAAAPPAGWNVQVVNQ